MEIWLREREVGSFWVFPVLETDANRLKITLVITVGAFDEAITPIEAATIDARVFSSAGAPLEQLTRPAPGPLELRGGPSVQSTCEFTFRANPNPAKIDVRIGEHSTTFNTQDRRRALQEFPEVPNAGDEYPPTHSDGALERILNAILSVLRKIGRFFKNIFGRKCCVNVFDCPANRVPAGKSESFEMNATFQAAGGDCRCHCCEYRQYVRGAFRNAAGRVIPFALPSGPFSETEYREDGIPNLWGRGRHAHYGHRDLPRNAFDEYLPQRDDGCRYRGRDIPRCGPTDTLHAEFLGLIIDVCRGEIVATRTWVVNL